MPCAGGRGAGVPYAVPIIHNPPALRIFLAQNGITQHYEHLTRIILLFQFFEQIYSNNSNVQFFAVFLALLRAYLFFVVNSSQKCNCALKRLKTSKKKELCFEISATKKGLCPLFTLLLLCYMRVLVQVLLLQARYSSDTLAHICTKFLRLFSLFDFLIASIELFLFHPLHYILQLPSQ